MNIAIDIDGVIANFHTTFSTYLNNMYGTPIVNSIDEVASWRWEDWIGLSKEEIDKAWDRVKQEKNFWLRLTPLVDKNIFTALSKLSRRGNMFFITSRKCTGGSSLLTQTDAWLKIYMPYAHFSVIPTNRKGALLSILGADYFIDDKPANVLDVATQVPECKTYLLVRTYNSFAIEYIRKETQIRIIYNIEEFIDDIREAIQ